MSSGRDDKLSLTYAGHVALIKFDDPQTLNGIHRDNLELFPALVAEAEATASIRYIVVQGDARHFCGGGAGDFLAEIADLDLEERVLRFETGQRWVNVLLRSPCLTVAAIEGLAVGAGVDFALAFDAALLWPGARMSFFYNRLGAIPDLGGLWLLSELIGPRRALSFLASGEVWEAERLVALGLGEAQTQVCPVDAAGWSQFLSRRYPIARAPFGAAKRALNGPRLDALSEHQREVARLQAEIFGTPEFREKLARVSSLRRLIGT